MTIRDIVKLLNSGVPADTQIAAEILKANKELHAEYFTFHSYIGNLDYGKEKEVKEHTGYSLNELYRIGDNFPVTQDKLLKEIKKMWSKNDKQRKIQK